jgi:hypothetical protein
VNGHGLFEITRRHLVYRADFQDAGVVDEQIDGPITIGGAPYEALGPVEPSVPSSGASVPSQLSAFPSAPFGT